MTNYSVGALKRRYLSQVTWLLLSNSSALLLCTEKTCELIGTETWLNPISCKQLKCQSLWCLKKSIWHGVDQNKTTCGGKLLLYYLFNFIPRNNVYFKIVFSHVSQRYYVVNIVHIHGFMIYDIALIWLYIIYDFKQQNFHVPHRCSFHRHFWGLI